MSTQINPKRRLLGSNTLIEEETVRGYRAQDYYPVKIGQTFQNQYLVVGKLGYGSASTVWLCRDLQGDKAYVALKVYINNSREHRELSICRHINDVVSEHQGKEHVRKLLDSFEVEGPHGKHICLAYEPLGNSLSELRLLADGPLEAHIVRQTMRPVLIALQFLHTDAHVIHTDLQSNNILLGIHDSAILDEFEREEMLEPSACKELEDRTIYVSRPMRLAHGWPSLSDFSEARFGETEHTDLVMPNVYRAPEVILGMPWSYPVDLWAFAMVIWELFEPKRLFAPKDEHGRYSEVHHLAQMVSILGPPPQDFLMRSSKCAKFWDQNGQWIGDVPIPQGDLNSAETLLATSDKAEFLDFLRKMLQWKPEDRGNCHDVYFSEWLVADLIESGQIVRDDE